LSSKPQAYNSIEGVTIEEETIFNLLSMPLMGDVGADANNRV